ncbi:MAG: hypothetical protein ACE5PV_12360 [Candidatus Poribacteria bacterium]
MLNSSREPPFENRKRRHNQNSIVAAIDIGVFTDVERYKSHVDNLIDGIKALPKGAVRNPRRMAERFKVEFPSG